MNDFFRKLTYALLGIMLLSNVSCKKEQTTSEIYTVRQWKADLSTGNVLPAITGRTDHAVAVFYLMTDNNLYYDIFFDKTLNNGDTPNKGAVYAGAAGTTGTILIDLANGAFDSKGEVKGSVMLSPQLISDINSKILYLQISSTQQPNGLVRGAMTSY